MESAFVHLFVKGLMFTYSAIPAWGKRAPVAFNDVLVFSTVIFEIIIQLMSMIV